jgi:hypothetical protein
VLGFTLVVVAIAAIVAKYQYEDVWWVRWPSWSMGITLVVGITLVAYGVTMAFIAGSVWAIMALILVAAGTLLEWRVGPLTRRRRVSATPGGVPETRDAPRR